MIGGQREVGPVLLQEMQQPVGELEIAVAGALGLPQRLDERLVADAVQLAGDRFDADVCAHGLPLLVRFRRPTLLRDAADDMESRVGADRLVGLRPVRRHPARPAELRALARAGPA